MIHEEFRANSAKYRPGAFTREASLDAVGNLRYPIGTVIDTDWTDATGHRVREQLVVESAAALDSEFVTCCFFVSGTQYTTTRLAAECKAAACPAAAGESGS